MSENETEVVVPEEETETPEAELTETTDWEAEAKKARGIAQRLRTKLTKAEEKKVAAPPKEEAKPKTGELDETSVLWLEVKGVKTEDADEMKLVETWQKDSGKDVKAIFASKIFQAELKDLRDQKAVQDATPSNTKRGGQGNAGSLDAAVAKYERDGTLPDDFDLRSQVINRMEQKSDVSRPAWRR